MKHTKHGTCSQQAFRNIHKVPNVSYVDLAICSTYFSVVCIKNLPIVEMKTSLLTNQLDDVFIKVLTTSIDEVEFFAVMPFWYPNQDCARPTFCFYAFKSNQTKPLHQFIEPQNSEHLFLFQEFLSFNKFWGQYYTHFFYIIPAPSV